MLIANGVEPSSVSRAVEFLRQGELVGLPTETVYGLAADATSAKALSKLYSVKGRPGNHPVIVHLWSVDQVPEWAVAVPDCLKALAESFWPGPLTVVLRRAPHVLDQVTGGQNTVALRIPAHPVALRLLEAFGKGLAAPSANRFGKLSPTRAQDVINEFSDEVAMVLDGGACGVGIESTILDLSGGAPRVLRPGMILPEQIEPIIGVPVKQTDAQTATEVRVPGSLAAHYAPATPVILVARERLAETASNMLMEEKRVVVLSHRPVVATAKAAVWVETPEDAPAYARDLYCNLRAADAAKADCILVERPPQSSEWAAVLDRLARAAASQQVRP